MRRSVTEIASRTSGHRGADLQACRGVEETGELTREVPFGKDFPGYPCPVPTHPRLAGTGESREAGCLPQRPGAGIPSYLRRDPPTRKATCGGIRLRHLLRRGYEGQEGYLRRDAAFTDCPGTEAATSGGSFRFPRRTGASIFCKVRVWHRRRCLRLRIGIERKTRRYSFAACRIC